MPRLGSQEQASDPPISAPVTREGGPPHSTAHGGHMEGDVNSSVNQIHKVFRNKAVVNIAQATQQGNR